MNRTLQELSSRDWRRRRQAVRHLASLSQQSAGEFAEGLLTLVQDHNMDLGALNASLQVLGTLGPTVIERLEPLLEHPLVEVRLAAGVVLGQMPDGLGEPLLLRMLADEDDNVRYHAVEGLGLQGSTRALPALVEQVLADDYFLAFAAVEALGKIAAAGAAPELCERLSDDFLREPCIEALGRLGHCLALPALLQHLSEAREAVLLAVYRIEQSYANEPGREAQVARLIGRHLSADAAEMLLKASASFPSELQPALARVLAVWHGEQAQPAPRDDLLALLEEGEARTHLGAYLARFGLAGREELLRRLTHDDGEVRLLAAEALAETGDARSLDTLCALLASPQSPWVTRTLQGLARLGSTRALPAVMAQLGHKHPTVREAAIQAASEIEGALRVSVAYLDDPNPTSRAAAIRLVRTAPGVPVESAVLQRIATEDPDLRVRCEALHTLTARLDREPELEPFLARLLAEGPPAEKAAMTRALGEVAAPEAQSLLKTALQSTEMWTLIHGCRSAARIQARALLGTVEGLLCHAAAPVRAEAAKAVGSLAPDRAAEVLLPLLDDPARDVVLAAAAGLGRAASPAALRALAELGGHPELVVRQAAVEGLAGAERWDEQTEAVLQAAILQADQAEGALEALLASPHPHSRRFLLAHLPLVGRHGRIAERLVLSEAELRQLGEVVTHSERASARLAAIPLLVRQRTRGAQLVLESLLGDRDPWVRREAILGLLDMNAARPARLAELADTDPDAGVRRTARLAMAV